jgi:hypothetical protein
MGYEPRPMRLHWRFDYLTNRSPGHKGYRDRSRCAPLKTISRGDAENDKELAAGDEENDKN